MPSISIPGAIIGGAAISAGGSLLGGLTSSSGALAAAKQQAWANEMAALMAQQRYEQTRADLQPYNATGQSTLGPMSTYYQGTQAILDNAYNQTQAAIPTIPDQATLLNMPGYQFNLDQGLKATQAQETAQGKGLSGAATKAAQNYATGLANTYLGQYWNMAQQRYADYSGQFTNALAGRNAVFNQLYNPASLGENAAAMTGNTGAQLATTTANALAGMGNALAAGTANSAGAISQGLQNASNTIGGNLLTYAMLANQPQNVNIGGGGNIQGQVYPNYSGSSGVSPAVDSALSGGGGGGGY